MNSSLQNPKMSKQPLIFFELLFYYIIHMACIYVHVTVCVHLWCPWRSEEDIRFPGIGITDGLLGVMWVLGNKLQVSAKTANVLNC